MNPRAPYTPAISPRLRLLLGVVFASVAWLGATGGYLSAIRAQEWLSGQTVTNQFTLWAFLGHVVIGVVLSLPFVAFGVRHWRTAARRPNRAAVRLGIWVFGLGLLTILTGLALIQLDGLLQLPTGSVSRGLTLVLHGLAPLVAVGLYVAHRRAGPPLQWQWGAAWAAAVAVFVGAALWLHHEDPRHWYAQGPSEGERYFHPAATRTADGNFIPADTLMMDRYCLQCHADAYQSWFHSAHHFSSFNNPAYLFSVRETRKVSLERDGDVRASRWCAGCHDPVPFLSGAFDDPKFDDERHATAHAGITCTVCHAMTHIGEPTGNGGYTLEEPLHYPFAQSEQPLLQWVNRQLVRAKPDFHKKTFLKPFHRSAEFCATCHKVSLPPELNHYKEFLRGQNHYDSFLLSGVSGHGARSFYYPEKAKENCASCHMPLTPSRDPAARDFAGTGQHMVHDHLFPGANSALPWLLSREPRHQDDAAGFRRAAERHEAFLADKQLRIDLFGLKEGGRTDGRLVAPLRPELPELQPGGQYLIEVVIRTLGVGHHFTQGTADSNEIWVEFTATSGGRLLGQSGDLAGPGESGPLDPGAHRVNVLMLDREGQRINRRNPQDIFTPLYNHQIPPGAAQVVHYRLDLPQTLTAPVELRARLRYRKFDHEYMSLIYPGPEGVPTLPIVDLAEDRVTLPVPGRSVEAQVSSVKPAWQRWNDYGIGCLLEGGAGSKRGELRQALAAFEQVARVPEAAAHGHLNRTRVLLEEGLLTQAAEALNAARTATPPAPWWLLAWFQGLVTVENAGGAADLDAAIAAFESILEPANQPTSRGFDFSKDYVVRNRLANTLFQRSQLEADPAGQQTYLRRAITAYEATLTLDSEDLEAHFGLARGYARLAGELPSADTATDEEPTTLTATLRDPQRPREERLRAAAQLLAAIRRLEARPFDPHQPRLPPLQALRVACRPVFQDADPNVSTATAAVLAAVHRATHAILRPDDNAQARATAIYRQSHPEADRAAEAVVVYPLHGGQP